jgi:hypothetical protein
MKTTVFQSRVLRGAAALFLAAPGFAWAQSVWFPVVPWGTDVTAAGMASGVSGNAQVGRIPDSKYSEQTAKFDSGFVTFETGQGESGFLIDVQHNKLAQDSDLLAGGKFGHSRLEGRQNVVQLAGLARLSGNDPELLIDIVGGVRYASVELEQRLEGLAPCNDKRTWTNGFVGMRMLQQLNDRWWMDFYVDGGGGGGAESFLAKLGGEYRMTGNASFKFGYRILGMKYEKPEFNYNLRTGGLYAGLGMRF